MIWAYAGYVHHDFDIAQNEDIYAAAQVYDSMPKDMEFIIAPAMADVLVILGPDGKEKDSIPLLEASAIPRSRRRWLRSRAKPEKVSAWSESAGKPAPVQASSPGDI